MPRDPRSIVKTDHISWDRHASRPLRESAWRSRCSWVRSPRPTGSKGCDLLPFFFAFEPIDQAVRRGIGRPPETVSSETPPGKAFNERIDPVAVTLLRRSGHGTQHPETG